MFNFITGNKFKSLEGGNIIFSKIDNVSSVQLPNTPFKLITHNGDLPVCRHHLKILDNPFLIKWYGTNIEILHPKAQPIPIGIDNQFKEEWYHLPEYGGVVRSKVFYFRHWGDSMVKPYRDSVRTALESQGYVQEKKQGINEYLSDLQSAMFCPCPNGNGIDTHSLWECIYMGCVPIVEVNGNVSAWHDLPVLIINNWNKIPRLSAELYKEIRKKSTEKADFNYWKKIIQA